MLNIVKQEYSITKNDQNSFKGHQSFLIWFTGLSGSGKSTIANELLNQLYKKGFHVYALDGDNIRFGLNKDLSFSTADRTENLRRIGEVSKLLIDAGIITIAAFVSPLIEHRESIKSIVGSENFIEIFVNTSIEECEKRDVKGLYAKARKGEIKDFTGIDAPYEIPLSPNIEINTIQLSVEKAVEKIFDYLTEKLTIKQ